MKISIYNTYVFNFNNKMSTDLRYHGVRVKHFYVYGCIYINKMCKQIQNIMVSESKISIFRLEIKVEKFAAIHEMH